MEHEELVKSYEEKARGARRVTVDLSVPIRVNGVEVSEITLRRPTVGDIRRANADHDSGHIALVAALADVAPKDLDTMDAADFDCVEAVVLGFRGQRVAR
jgi:hypothetical protein